MSEKDGSIRDIRLTKLVNIWMENLGSEQNLGWDHRVLIWKVKLCREHAAAVGSAVWACNLNEEVPVVGLTWLSVDTDN